jgi:class 3 adenylate cyclase
LLVRSPIPALCGTALGLLMLAGAVYQAFGMALLLPAVPAAIAWIGSAGLTNQIMHAASNRTRALLRKSFEHYLPPPVIARMLASGALPKLGGERREISVLFTDVAGFTTFSETVEPEFLATICNDYFDGVCAAIFAEGGMVNEFIGDAVLAFFGAPVDQPDHADRAVTAALGIDAFARRFSAEQEARGIHFGHTRIGVHTGIAMVGNVGTRSRLKYSALGDMLNTGSRLEGLNKTIGTRICVSGEIVGKAQRHRFRPIGSFVVKGRHAASDVFEPLAAEDLESERIGRYETAFRMVMAGLPEAAEQFTALRRDYPEDPCVAFHCQRLEAGESGTLIVMTEK